MSESFKPFFVDLSESDAMSHSSGTLTPGRYLVVAVIGGISQLTNNMMSSLLAYPVEGDKRLVLISATASKFVGFRGDCILCDKRKPEEGP